MGAVKKRIDKSVLRRLIPLRTLSEESFERLLNKTLIEEYTSGHQLFKQGDVNNEHIYLIAGKVVLNSEGNVSEIISSNDEEAKLPLAHEHPRKVTAVAKSKITLARVDSQLLGVLLSGNEKDAYAVADIKEEESGDWMTMLLQSRAFENTPPATMQKIFVKLEPIEVKAGDVIVEQDSVGDYYYIIQSGRCKVTRKSPNSNEEITLAELGHGDTFGEEALIANGKRNATISMLTDGVIMRLFKDDFDELVKRPLLNWVDRGEADQMITGGGMWVDARMTSEYEKAHMPESVSIPLSMIRDRVVSLDTGKKYVVYCDTGKRSSVAAFLLSQRGFDAYVLDGGLNLAEESTATSGNAATAAVAEKPAAVPVKEASGQAAPQPKRPVNVEEQQRRSLAEEEVKQLKAEQQEAIKRAQQEAEHFRKQAELAKKQAEEQSKRLQAEREAARAEAETARKRLEEEQRNSAQLAEAEVERIKAEAEAAKRHARAEAERLKAEADVARQMAEKEAQRLRQEQAAARKHAEEEATRLRAEAESIRQEAERVKAEAIASQRGREEEEAAKLKAAREAVRLEMEEELARLRAEAEEARLKTEVEAQKNAEAELQKLNAEQEAARLKAEAEDARLKAEEVEAQAKAEAEAVRLRAEQEIARLKSEAESARIQAEEHAAILMTEAQNTRLQVGAAAGEMTQAAQLESEAKAAHMEAAEAERIKEQIEATRQAAEQEMRRMIAEAEETRKQAEKDAHRLINEAETMRMKAEEEVKRAQDEAQNERKQALAESERLQNEVHNAEQRAQETIRKLEQDMAALTASAAAAGSQGTATDEEDVINADSVDEIASYISSRGTGAGSKVTTLEDLLSTSQVQGEPAPEPAASDAGGKKTGLMIGGGVAVLLIVVIGGWLAMSGGEKKAPVTATEAPIRPEATTAAPPATVPEAAPPQKAETKAEPAFTAAAEKPAAEPPAKTFQDALKSGGKGPVMVAIAGGQYDMGSSGLSPNADERPRHTVTLKDFAISQHEITVGDFKRYLRATGKALRSSIGKTDDRPAVNVSWKEAVDYAAWLGRETGKQYRLATEAEWEYAATGGEDNAFFWWGIDVGTNNASCFDCSSQHDISQPAPVGSFKPNKYGVYDTAGNVREWVQDCYHGSYKGAPEDGSAWQESNCEMRVLRGGAFNKPAAQMIPAKRDKAAPDMRDDNTGFRVVLGS
jgi:formylglycine-generating enzyme required for sulfatase activity/CRP-like cAMP-binding protein